MLIAFEISNLNVSATTPHIFGIKGVSSWFLLDFYHQILIPTSCACVPIHVFFFLLVAFWSLKHCEYIEQRCSEGRFRLNGFIAVTLLYMEERQRARGRQRICIYCYIRGKIRVYSGGFHFGYSYLSSYSDVIQYRSHFCVFPPRYNTPVHTGANVFLCSTYNGIATMC